MTTTTSISQTPDYSNYIIPPENEIESVRQGGRFNQVKIVKYPDQREWVFLNNRPEERFCGFLYLQDALKKHGLSDQIEAAANKIATHEGQILYFSEYCGEEKPEYFAHFKEIGALARPDGVGFKDTSCCANLRKKNGKIYVFDTEKASFHNNVHEKIDSFAPQHLAIRSELEKLKPPLDSEKDKLTTEGC